MANKCKRGNLEVRHDRSRHCKMWLVRYQSQEMGSGTLYMPRTVGIDRFVGRRISVME